MEDIGGRAKENALPSSSALPSSPTESANASSHTATAMKRYKFSGVHEDALSRERERNEQLLCEHLCLGLPCPQFASVALIRNSSVLSEYRGAIQSHARGSEDEEHAAKVIDRLEALVRFLDTPFRDLLSHMFV